MSEVCERQFASCKIDWNIENYCLAFSSANDPILSPEFYLQGFNSVKWRMRLELDSKNLIAFYLKKITTSEPKNLLVSFEVTLKAGDREFFGSGENIEFGENCEHGQRGIVNNDEIIELLLPLTPDTLFIHLYFTACNMERPLISDEFVEFGLLRLSSDLECLKDTEKSYADINLKIGDQNIEAHKAILSRNKTFESYIEEANNGVIEIRNVNYEALDHFVSFMYSGNVKHLLKEPSISMMKCLEHFNCDALESYYIPEKTSVKTKTKVHSHEFRWYIPDILDKPNFSVTSRAIKKFNVNTVWQLTVSNDHNSNFISIFADITEGDKPRYFCLEFAVIDDGGRVFFPKRILRKNGYYGNMGFKEFVKLESVFNNPLLIENECVRFLFKVRTSDGNYEESTGPQITSLITPADVPLYKELSSHMAQLLEKGKYSDLCLKCEKKIIKAHKGVLAARSPGFRKMIENMSPDQDTLIVNDIEFHVLKIIVNYIYTGSCDEFKGTNVVRTLIEASIEEKFNIPSLKEECKRLSQKKVFKLGDIKKAVEKL